MKTVFDIPDEELLRRAVSGCKTPLGKVMKPRWSLVMTAFALGSTYSAQLCRRFNLDPEEMV